MSVNLKFANLSTQTIIFFNGTFKEQLKLHKGTLYVQVELFIKKPIKEIHIPKFVICFSK